MRYIVFALAVAIFGLVVFGFYGMDFSYTGSVFYCLAEIITGRECQHGNALAHYNFHASALKLLSLGIFDLWVGIAFLLAAFYSGVSFWGGRLTGDNLIKFSCYFSQDNVFSIQLKYI